MRHIIFEEHSQYEIAILIKESAFKKKSIKEEYVEKSGLHPEKFIAFDLKYKEDNKTAPASMRKSHLSNVLKASDSLKVKYLLVCDVNYFKTLTGLLKAEPHYGYALPCALKGFEHLQVILCPNYQALFYNPTVKERIDLALKALTTSINNTYVPPGQGIIHNAQYPKTITDIEKALLKLHEYPELTCDIETFSLALDKAYIASIAFAWSKHEGVVFPVDLIKLASTYNPGKPGQKTTHKHNYAVRDLLLSFFQNYQGKLVFHNANFDIKILIYNLFMRESPLNYGATIIGINTMTAKIDDTKIIAYLAINSTARNSLRLKDLTQEFAGNYAQEDIDDITLIDYDQLLEYNLVDALATWYAKEKYHPIMIQDNQLDIYNEIMLPSIKVILNMELVGMPVSMGKINLAEKKLTKIQDDLYNDLYSLKEIREFQKLLQTEAMLEANLKLKVKVKPIEDFQHIQYNPNSPIQTSKLLFDKLKLKPIDFTPTGAASVGNKTLIKLINSGVTKTQEKIIRILMDLADVSIILNNFIKNFKEKSIKKSDGYYYLHGNFNLGGTVSGRLSSSDPNMQNIPSTGTVYAKIIKECFIAPSGWLMMGADFASLEDRISALTTKDPNKLKVYEQGYDGHCLRAFYYFGDQMTGIVDTVKSINSIEQKYPHLRQDSKAPTFLLTYGGKYYGLMQNVGLSEKMAKKIEANYHEMYSVSDAWVADKLNQATKDGYVTVAFGLRVRTPILQKTYLGKYSTPKEAEAEGRTAGNALGQSYGLLNNRAGIEFQERVLNSKYKYMIKPIAQIHDSQYFIVQDHLGCVKWFNDNLVECMEWQQLPEIQHPRVKLGGNVEIYYPSWAKKHVIPNKASKKDILKISREAFK